MTGVIRIVVFSIGYRRWFTSFQYQQQEFNHKKKKDTNFQNYITFFEIWWRKTIPGCGVVRWADPCVVSPSDEASDREMSKNTKILLEYILVRLWCKLCRQNSHIDIISLANAEESIWLDNHTQLKKWWFCLQGNSLNCIKRATFNNCGYYINWQCIAYKSHLARLNWANCQGLE